MRCHALFRSGKFGADQAPRIRPHAGRRRACFLPFLPNISQNTKTRTPGNVPIGESPVDDEARNFSTSATKDQPIWSHFADRGRTLDG